MTIDIKTRQQEMDEQAKAFHQKNPKVSLLFDKFTYEVISRGFSHYSVNAIFERIRWETDQADTDGKSTFKLNNNYRAWYARRFMKRFPQYTGFFRTRTRQSKEWSATNLPELRPEFYEEDND